jgi:hypothetical protein
MQTLPNIFKNFLCKTVGPKFGLIMLLVFKTLPKVIAQSNCPNNEKPPNRVTLLKTEEMGSGWSYKSTRAGSCCPVVERSFYNVFLQINILVLQQYKAGRSKNT